MKIDEDELWKAYGELLKFYDDFSISYFTALKLIQKNVHVGIKRAKQILRQMFYLGLWEWDGDGKIKIKKPQLILGGENLEKEN